MNSTDIYLCRKKKGLTKEQCRKLVEYFGELGTAMANEVRQYGFPEARDRPAWKYWLTRGDTIHTPDGPAKVLHANNEKGEVI